MEPYKQLYYNILIYRTPQKTIHAAAKAIRNAMDFAPNLASLEKPTEKTTKTGKAEKVAEQPAGTVADESKKAA